LIHATAFLLSGGTTQQLIESMVSSPEFLQEQGKGTSDGFLDAIYQDALNRVVDPVGRAGWNQILATGTNYAQVALAILSSPEFQTNQVEGMYARILRRPADPTALNAFVSLLQHGGTYALATALIIGSDEYFASAQA
jgi:hypothetical protein